MPESFIKEVLEAVRTRTWIRHTNHEITGKAAKLRLHLDDERFVAVYYNSETGSISFAYIEKEKRLFGANNIRIGWHIHPWEREAEHVRSEPMNIEQFLKRLEDELINRGKLP